MRRLHHSHGALPGGAGRYVEDPTDNDFAAAARWALTARNLPLAVEQVSAAIALRPLHEPHLRLLDEILGKARGPLLLVELPKDGAFFGLCAVRARVLARLNRLDEAIDALFAAAAFSPSTPFVPWAPSWVNTAKSARRVQPNALAVALVMLADAARELAQSEGTRSNLGAALTVAEAVQAHHPRSTSLLSARSRTLRALGRVEEALALLDVERGAQTWEIAVERAAIHGERGELSARIEWLDRARQERPGELSTYLDLGDAHLEDGALEPSIHAYERALELDASSGWAMASAGYARALAAGARGGPAISRAVRDTYERERVRALDADLAAYQTRLADPTDPLVGVIRSVRIKAAQAQSPTKLHIRVQTERPLAPSASIAFALAASFAGNAGTLRVVHESVLPPQVGPLWQGDAEGTPAVPRPPDEVIDRVLDLAQMPFLWDPWCARAAELTAALKADKENHFVHAMAYPPHPPTNEVDPARWVHGFQVAAALLVALSPEPADARGKRLEALLSGVDDWSVGAALLGLRALADVQPELRREIVERARSLLPGSNIPLPPFSHALAVVGCELTLGSAQRDFLRLRSRVRAEIVKQHSSHLL